MNDKNQSLDENEKNIQDNDNFEVSEKLNLGLYNKICSTLLNVFSNSFIRNLIKQDKNILNLVQLQISNLFFLEKEIESELKDHKFARKFLQILANLTSLELSIKKSGQKNRIDILEDCNLLIVTIINTDKNVDRESLERYRTINQDAFDNLDNQISVLDDFSQISEKNTYSNNNNSSIKKEENSNQQFNNSQQFNNNNFANNFNPNDMANLNNLSKMGVLPQHPATKPNFYPYLTKPKVVGKIKKIISGLVLFSALLLVITIIISFFVKGQITFAKDGDKKDFSLSQVNNWILLVVTIGIYIWAAYTFSKPPRFPREKYHTSFFVLIILIFWLFVNLGYLFFSTSDDYFKNLFQQFLEKNQTLNSDVIAQLKNLPNFKLYSTFSIITAGFNVVPIVFLILLVLINPRLDKSKILRANQEYQNAIAAAMSGKSYEIDPTLFDNDLVDDKNGPKNSPYSGSNNSRF